MILRVILLTIIIEIFLILSTISVMKKDQDKYTSKSNALLTEHYTHIVDHYKSYSRYIVENHIKKEHILKQIYQAIKTEDPSEQNRIRTKLYQSLKEDYQKYLSFGFKQLHFHTPDVKSFLRMHRPNKFGDDLSGVRETLVFANKNKIEVFGFEEGRIFNGFRYVYPLTYKDEHIGTVELSVSAKAILKLLNDFFDNKHSFIIDNKVVKAKLFKDELSNYTKSCYEGFSKEAADQALIDIYQNVESKLCGHIDDGVIKSFDQQVKNSSNFSVPFELNSENYIVTYLPVKNISGKKVAYLIRYSHDAALAEIKTHYTYYAIFLSAINILLALAYILISKRKKEQETIKELLKTQIIEREQKIKAQEEMMVHQSKLSVAGEMINFVAHEWKQPLNSLSLILQCMNDAIIESGEKESYSDDIELCLTQIEHMDSVVKNFLNFIKPSQNKCERAQLKECIDYSIAFLQGQFKKSGVNLILKTPKANYDNVFLKGSKSELEMVLLNLLNNAKDAIVERKRLEEDSVPGLIEIVVEMFNNCVEIVISDNGTGIKENVIGKIFEPYVTTKGFSGTGIGLYVCKIVIEQRFGGSISCENTSKGAMFKICIDT